MSARKRRNPVKKQKFEFSKKLAVSITVLFILTWVVAWVVWIITKDLPEQMLNFISVPFSIVITGYFAKAGVENYEKIKVSNENNINERGYNDG